MISNLDYYKAFFYVATYSSFSDAARALYISQSAVSQTIRKLEEELSTTPICKEWPADRSDSFRRASFCQG